MNMTQFSVGCNKAISQHLSKPTRSDWMMTKQVLRYLKGTSTYSLVYKKSKNGLKIMGYSDSDWTSSTTDRRSTTGYIFQLNEEGAAVSWKSRKQQTVALSSCEAEYITLTAATQEAKFLLS